MLKCSSSEVWVAGLASNAQITFVELAIRFAGYVNTCCIYVGRREQWYASVECATALTIYKKSRHHL